MQFGSRLKLENILFICDIAIQGYDLKIIIDMNIGQTLLIFFLLFFSNKGHSPSVCIKNNVF
jgi:hypothetical protein